MYRTGLLVDIMNLILLLNSWSVELQMQSCLRVCVGGGGGGGVINYNRDQDVGSHCNRFSGCKNITLSCYSL